MSLALHLPCYRTPHLGAEAPTVFILSLICLAAGVALASLLNPAKSAADTGDFGRNINHSGARDFGCWLTPVPMRITATNARAAFVQTDKMLTEMVTDRQFLDISVGTSVPDRSSALAPSRLRTPRCGGRGC